MGVWLFSGGCESSVWGKYAATEAVVHALACDVEKSRRTNKPGTDFQYMGFVSANAGRIRSIRTARGYGFSVTHAPEEGRHHAHICYRQYGPPGAPSSPNKNDRSELKLALRAVYGDDITRHNCGGQPLA